MPSKIADYLPQLDSFLRQLTDDVKSQKITSWKTFAVSINAFYTPEMMNKIEAIAPGWIEMASYNDGITLSHVTSVFVALMLSEEYQSATEEQRSLMEWAVLFHDITKVPVTGGHDYVHGFKSAAIAGKTLTKLNFPTNTSQQEIDAWYDLTYNATKYSHEHNENIQDLSKLPQIIDGLKHIHNDDAYSIVLSILLHIAIVTDPHYPILSPMNEDDMKYSIKLHDLPVMKGMFLADGSGWELFAEDKSVNVQRQADCRQALEKIETLLTFSHTYRSPKIKDYLPEFTHFLKQITDKVKSKKIASWSDFKVLLNPFYSPDMMNKIEAIAPGWIQMASYRDGATLIHVTAVFVALMLSEEYQSATEEQRSLMEWAVLFHDITKIPVKGGHDYVHGFKSAAIAGKTLTRLNFPTNASQQEIDAWHDLTYHATRYSDEHGETIQDSEKFPQIIEGLQAIHSEDATAIVLAVLLHLAITEHPDYPSLAPISEADMKRYITAHHFPVIKGMMLADGNAWHLFDEGLSEKQHRQNYAQNVFASIADKLNLYTKPV